MHSLESYRAFSKVFGAVAFLVMAGTVVAQHPLDSWARRPVPGLTTNLSAVAFGNGVFVAVGEGSTVVTSSDGETWAVSIAGAYGNLARVRFLNGQFVAVGTSDKILFSANGATWAAATLPTAISWDVAYGNGVYVAAGVTTSVSSNGADWRVSWGSLDSVAFGNGRFVALPKGAGFPQLFSHTVHSTNGVDWVDDILLSESGVLVRTTIGEVIFGGGTFVGEAAQWEGVFATSDGTAWCCGFKGQDLKINGGIAYGQGYFIWAGYPEAQFRVFPFIYSSTNGMLWDTRFAPSPAPDANDPTLSGTARGAAFGNDTFVFVGDGGYIIQSGSLGGKPLIIHQPQDRAAIVGNPASFSVQAVGTPPLEFQWFHNGSVIANATNTSYTISQVQASDGGGYRVVIANSFGSVTSRVAQLSVAFLDIDQYAGVKILGLPGRTYRIEATPASGTPNWQVMTNLVLPSNLYIWIDYESPSVPARFYRAAELP